MLHYHNFFYCHHCRGGRKCFHLCMCTVQYVCLQDHTVSERSYLGSVLSECYNFTLEIMQELEELTEKYSKTLEI